MITGAGARGAATNWRAVAPAALRTFAAIEHVAASSLDESILAPTRRTIASILGVAVGDIGARTAASTRVDACVEFAEQFVVDVAGITAAQREAMSAAMGPDTFAFVQVLFVADVFTRARIAISRLFGEPYDFALETPAEGAELWPLLEQFMHEVALLDALDPLTTELVRLRGARVHNCRLCQSRRSVKALDAAGDRALLEIDDRTDPALRERDRVALALADALVTQPGLIDSAMVAAVHARYSVEEITEIVLDVVRNATNKIAVALGADAPVVASGVEFYDIDASGDVVADVDIAVVRAATGG